MEDNFKMVHEIGCQRVKPTALVQLTAQWKGSSYNSEKSQNVLTRQVTIR